MRIARIGRRLGGAGFAWARAFFLFAMRHLLLNNDFEKSTTYPRRWQEVSLLQRSLAFDLPLAGILCFAWGTLMRVLIVRSAQKEIENLPEEVLVRVRQRILALQADPLPRDAQKLRTSEDYRLRVGNYRIIYAMDRTRDLVMITRVRHRREVYR